MSGTSLGLVERRGLWVVEYKKEKSIITRIGIDSTGSPEFGMYSDGTNNAYQNSIIPVEDRLTMPQKWGDAVNSPKGHFITFVAPMDAFRAGVIYTVSKSEREEVDKELSKILKRTDKAYKLKAIHTLAVILARALGRSLVFKMWRGSKSRKGKSQTPVYLRVIPITEEYIDYNDITGEPRLYRPIITVGKVQRQIYIPADEAVLYVHKRDPMGNWFQGIQETYPIHNQLKWELNIEKGWAEAMVARGISMMHMQIKGFDIDDINKWKKRYGNPTSYNVVFTDEDTNVKTIEGVKSTFNLNENNEAFTKHASEATGMAMSRVDGTQRGLAGAEADTDNYYAILNIIQEEHEDQHVELYELVNPSVIDKFALSYDVQPKMDKAKRAQLFQTNVNSAQVGAPYMSYNQILSVLDLDPVDGGDENAEVYIYKMRKKAGMIDEYEENGSSDNIDDKDENGQKPSKTEKPDPSSVSKTGRRTQRREAKNPTEKRGGERQKDSTYDNIQDLLVVSKRNDIIRGLWAGDSYNKINMMLLNKYNISVSNNTIAEIKRYVTSFKHRKDNNGKSVEDCIKYLTDTKKEVVE